MRKGQKNTGERGFFEQFLFSDVLFFAFVPDLISVEMIHVFFMVCDDDV